MCLISLAWMPSPTNSWLIQLEIYMGIATPYWMHHGRRNLPMADCGISVSRTLVACQEGLKCVLRPEV